MQQLFGARDSLVLLEQESAQALAVFAKAVGFELPASTDGTDGAERMASLCAQAAAYLVREVANESGAELWVISGAGEDLAAALQRELERGGQWPDWQRSLEASAPTERWEQARSWVKAFANTQDAATHAWVDDAASMLAVPVQRRRVNASLDATVEGLRGEHTRVDNGSMALNLNDFWRRFSFHRDRVVPGFQALKRLHQSLISTEKTRLSLAQFQAKPLPSFVRNRLIDEVYLPLIGDNLAKQIGTTGAGSRTDRMGLLLLISPPGYGKTTLMEYVADRLGLVFVRINCPALGHDVTALDPASAANSAA